MGSGLGLQPVPVSDYESMAAESCPSNVPENASEPIRSWPPECGGGTGQRMHSRKRGREVRSRTASGWVVSRTGNGEYGRTTVHWATQSGGHCPIHESKSNRRYCDSETRRPITSDACAVQRMLFACLGTDDPGKAAQDPRDCVAIITANTLCHRDGPAHHRSLRAFFLQRKYNGGS